MRDQFAAFKRRARKVETALTDDNKELQQFYYHNVLKVGRGRGRAAGAEVLAEEARSAAHSLHHGAHGGHREGPPPVQVRTHQTVHAHSQGSEESDCTTATVA